MLTSQVILVKQLDGNPNDISGSHLHGFFFKKILGTQNPKLGDKLHDPKTEKPFSISYLFPHQNMHWFRITSWDELIPEAVFAYFNEYKLIQLNQCQFKLIKTTTDPDFFYWANRQSIAFFIEEQLFEMNRFHMVHASATSFKSGNAHIPLPVPDLMIKSIYRKLPDEIKEVINDISVEQLIDILRLKSHKLSSVYNKKTYGSISSFKGDTWWQIDKKASPKIQKALRLLLNFSFYSGIGVKTTQGMGMCRIV